MPQRRDVDSIVTLGASLPQQSSPLWTSSTASYWGSTPDGSDSRAADSSESDALEDLEPRAIPVYEWTRIEKSNLGQARIQDPRLDLSADALVYTQDFEERRRGCNGPGSRSVPIPFKLVNSQPTSKLYPCAVFSEGIIADTPTDLDIHHKVRAGYCTGYATTSSETMYPVPQLRDTYGPVVDVSGWSPDSFVPIPTWLNAERDRIGRPWRAGPAAMVPEDEEVSRCTVPSLQESTLTSRMLSGFGPPGKWNNPAATIATPPGSLQPPAVAQASKTSMEMEKKLGPLPRGRGGPKRMDYSIHTRVNIRIGEKLTTMILKNIPCRKKQEDVMKHVDMKGFKHCYDFFYLPTDGKLQINLGYAFINLITPEDAIRFAAEMDGYRFSDSKSQKVCVTEPANVQGLASNIAIFERTRVMQGSLKPYFAVGTGARV